MSDTTLSSELPIQADVHMHTNHAHGAASTKAMYESARKKGLRIIGFSEHSPRPAGYTYASDYQDNLRTTFPAYIREVKELQEEAKQNGITVLLGLEVDYIAGQEGFAQTLCQEYPYDYVIGGLHFQGTWGFDGPPEAWERLALQERFAAYAAYYQDLTSMCRTGLFSIAAHPDLIKIYTVADFHRWLGTDEALPLIRETLMTLRDQGMAMEVSSAGLRKPCKEIYPCPVIMAEAASLGVRISFGADAHCTDTPAFAFNELSRYAASFGYGASVVYKQGKALEVPFSPAAAL